MKFGRRLQNETHEPYKAHYIAYKELKKAIKLITGSDTSNYTISEVTNNFGNLTGFAESAHRPPEAQFQNLLNFEVEKINNFSALIYTTITTCFQNVLRKLRSSDDIQTIMAFNALRNEAERAADEVSALHSYVRLNFIGFRKITKKYDKHSNSAASCWYLARLVKEKFINLNFDYLIELLSISFGELRRVRRLLRHIDSHNNTILIDSLQHQKDYFDEEEDDDDDAEPDVDIDDDKKISEILLNQPVDLKQSLSTNTTEKTESTEHFFESENVSNTTYLVGEDNMMKVKIHLSKHVPLISLGPVVCRPRSSSMIRSLIQGIPQHHQLIHNDTSHSKQLLPSSGSSSFIQQTASRYTRHNSTVSINENEYDLNDLRHNNSASTHLTIDDGTGAFINPSIYKFDQHRVSAGCVYFDNITDFPTYTQLLSEKIDEKKAECLRLRWSTKQMTRIDNNKLPVILEFSKAFSFAGSPNEWFDIEPQMDSYEWYTTIYDAVVLTRDMIPSLLNGTFNIDMWVSTCHYIQSTELEKAKNLLTRAIYLIQHKQYRPVFQHWIHRSAYRKIGVKVKHSIYAYLDENIRFFNIQSQSYTNEQLLSSFWIPPHLSCLIEDDIMKCSYGVLAISLAGIKRPSFLPELTGLTSVSEVWRYSPLLHGLSVFHHNELNNKALPHWFQFITNTLEDGKTSSETGCSWKAQNDPMKTKKYEQLAKGTTLGDGMRVDILSTKPRDRMLHEHAIFVQQELSLDQTKVGRDSFHSVSQISNDQQLDTVPNRQYVTDQRQFYVRHYPPQSQTLQEPLLSTIQHHYGRINASSTSPDDTQHIPIEQSTTCPLSDTHHRVSYFKRFSLICLNFFNYYIDPLINIWTLYIHGGGTQSGGICSSIGSATVRVEPKTFFANERTLLQWLNTAVLLSTISITLLNFGTSSGRTAGLIMAPVALFFIIYSFLVYLRRSYSLERKEPINYNDRLGPAILVCCLIIALSAIIILNIVNKDNKI